MVICAHSLTLPTIPMTTTPNPFGLSASGIDDCIVSIHQLVHRKRDNKEPEEWIVTNIEATSDGTTIILSDPGFNFRMTIHEDVFRDKDFEPKESADGTPVWGY